MIFRRLLILLSVLGISSTFMPWLHYPKPNITVYGYLSDGIVTGFLFFLIFIFSVYNFKKIRLNYIGSGLVAIIGLWMGVEAYKKIIEIEAEKLNFSSDNPIISLSTAGFNQGIGIYVMGLAGICIFTTIVIGLLFQFFNSDVTPKLEINTNIKRKELITLISSFGLIAICTHFFVFGKIQSRPDDDELKKSISESIAQMGKAILNENYDEFIKFNHPIMIQTYGGKQRTKDLLSATLTELKKSGYKVKSAELNQVYDVKYKQNSIQAIINQVLTLDSMSIDRTQIQKMIAISDNNGKSWSFINIDGKTKEEITALFPLINPDLKF